MKPPLLRFLDDRRGGSAPEYALILAGVAAAVAIGLALFGSTLGNSLRASAQYVDRVALNFGPSGAAATAAADQTAAAAAVPSQSAAASARGAASHGRSAGAPGHGARPAGQSSDAPGRGGSAPGNSENAPGQTK